VPAKIGPEHAIIIYMPRPPSLNKLWISVPGKKRVRSPAYNAWATTAGWEVKRQIVGMAPIACRFNLTIHVPISRRDTGNWEKAIGDLLQTVGVVTNDGNVHELIVRPMERDDCLVALEPLPEMGGVRAPTKLGRPPMKRKEKTPAAKVRASERVRAGVLF